MYVEYSSNNSGGGWWLDEGQWVALEKAGWKVHWNELHRVDGQLDEDGLPLLLTKEEYVEHTGKEPYRFGGRGEGKSKLGHDLWLGCSAKEAFLKCDSIREAADKWEEVTGANPLDVGCPCCGQPHNFTLYGDEGKWVDFGPKTDYEASW